MASAWDKDKTYKLIQLIEAHPELWNSELKQYRDRYIKAKAFENIGIALNVDAKEVNRKYHNLRCQLNHEIRKLKLKRTGTLSDFHIKSSWEFFDALSFMKGFTDFLRAVEMPLAEDGPDLVFYEEDAPTKSTTGRIKKTKTSPKTDEDKLFEEVLAKLRNPKDDSQIFGDFVASELREIRSDERRRRLKRTIQKVIIEMGEEESNEHSVW